ncbi:predicted protein [Phaeodactylum tricornutum CCAP 1055/1]|uniref:Haloacid dehalogenase-like hydrolase n=1 Tax=Phaeodactylum tricornutum (strain CCAP 1055/1) TaxID=556484 RepID=B7G5D1_PHATC|nr:predicted protein [Phaeodactylum tricornutum CCAP 1055/1]EEC46127.1 predicted protein [Phaeodactylum tricornutum CCAP 1055/1]|eukprot:XP_002182226.1 predicted protein [Phaeodactylum tricornutum CCAP 1055/1]
MSYSIAPSLILLFGVLSGGQAFQFKAFAPRSLTRVLAEPSTTAPADSQTSSSNKGKTLGLLTFDLDDTLYPIDLVLNEANAAFARAMENFGYKGIQPSDINETSKTIREEIAARDPQEAAALTHTELRKLAIRREMEQITITRKLQSCADDWATPVADLSPVVVKHAKKWATEAVSPTIVQAVLNAWEMERHHAAERHLYPECVEVFERIKQDHPDVIIGAVTDGKANPLFMTFTLAPYFDFCMSWEDDQAGRRKFFKELGSIEGNADLKWIYDAALEKYQELASAAAALQKGDSAQDPNKIWIHVGDDLAYDVGGSAQSGAKTILVELDDEKYHQTARHRFELTKQPDWSTTSDIELEKRKVMNEAATNQIDRKIKFLTRLPEAINEVLEEQS